MGGAVEAGTLKWTERTRIPRDVTESSHAIVVTTPVGAAKFRQALVIPRLASHEQGDE